MTIDTGFDLHVALSVDANGQRPKQAAVARRTLLDCCEHRGKNLTKLSEKWIDVSALGYETNWLWVIGGKFRPSIKAGELKHV